MFKFDLSCSEIPNSSTSFNRLTNYPLFAFIIPLPIVFETKPVLVHFHHKLFPR